MVELRDFLDLRDGELILAEDELDVEQAKLDARRKAIRAERDQIAAARLAISSKPKSPEVAGIGTSADGVKMTIKEMVVEVLGVLPRGADALEILRLINERFNAGLARTSLSPQLSRLKQEGLLDRQGMTWFLNEKGPAEAGPSLFLGAASAGGGFPPDRPEGAIPSASNPSHQNGSALHGDRSGGATAS